MSEPPYAPQGADAGGGPAQEGLPHVSRRDVHTPPPWYQPAAPTEPLGRGGKLRSGGGTRVITLVVAGAVALFLLYSLIDFAITFFTTTGDARVTLTFGFIYLGIIQVVGWWFVIYVLRRG